MKATTLRRKMAVNLLVVYVGLAVSTFAPLLASSTYWQSSLSTFGIHVAVLGALAVAAWPLWVIVHTNKEIAHAPN